MTTWHEKDCRRPDVVLMDNTPTCLSCGSIFLSTDEAQGQLSKQTAAADEGTPCLNLNWPSSITFSSCEDVTDPDLRRSLVELDRCVGVVHQDLASETKHSGPAALIDDHNTTGIEIEHGTVEGNSRDVTEAHTRGTSADDCESSAFPNSGLAVTPGEVELDTMRQADAYYALTGTDEIRLLHLDPHDNVSEPLHGCLTTTRLSQRPCYIALSYMWADANGDRTLSDKIFLGKAWTPLAITRNCAAALRRLRLRGGPCVLWVDSICIDQTNIGERSYQVSMMRDIYSRAESVAIFLGGDTNVNIDTPAGRLMQRLSDERFRAGRAVTNNWGGEFDYQGTCDLFEQPYWSRIWVIQEVLLARKAKIILGGAEVPLHEFIENFMKVLPETFKLRPPLWMYSLGGSRYGEVDAFYELLDKTATCKASDKRDMVFALFGLVPGANLEGLVADYSKTMAEIYTGLATYFLLHRGQSGLLEAAASAPMSTARIGPSGTHNGFSCSFRLPSWVWSATFSTWHDTGLREQQKTYISTELFRPFNKMERGTNHDKICRLIEVPPRSCKSPRAPLNTWKVFGNHGTLLIRASPVVHISYCGSASLKGVFSLTIEETHNDGSICVLKAKGTSTSWGICVHTSTVVDGLDDWIVEIPGCDTFLHLAPSGRVAGTYKIASMSSVGLASSYHTRYDTSVIPQLNENMEPIGRHGQIYENELDYRFWMPLVSCDLNQLFFLRQLEILARMERWLAPRQAGPGNSMAAELSPKLLDKYGRWLELHCQPGFQDSVQHGDFDSAVKTVSRYLERWEDRQVWFRIFETVARLPWQVWQAKQQELANIRAEAWQYLVTRSRSKAGDGKARGVFHWEQRLEELFNDLVRRLPDMPPQITEERSSSGGFLSMRTCTSLCKSINNVPESWTVEELQTHEAEIFKDWVGVEACWDFMNQSKADCSALQRKFAQLRALKRLCRREQRDFLIC